MLTLTTQFVGPDMDLLDMFGTYQAAHCLQTLGTTSREPTTVQLRNYTSTEVRQLRLLKQVPSVTLHLSSP